jgi:glycosyltransferase involved in cell wall biosynthesis
MTQPPLLSIVVPAYNVQKYLLECLDSAFMHRHTAMGMRLVDIPHGGVSSARNAGVRESRGEYIWMVDADDVVIPGALATVLAMLRRHRVDGYCFDLIFWEENGESDNWTESRLPPLTVMKDIPDVLRQSFIDGAMYPWRHVFIHAPTHRDGMRLVDIPHGGVSSARNAGVRESRGEYIWMVDADDVVIPGALATVLAMLRRHRVDGYGELPPLRHSRCAAAKLH